MTYFQGSLGRRRKSVEPLFQKPTSTPMPYIDAQLSYGPYDTTLTLLDKPTRRRQSSVL